MICRKCYLSAAVFFALLLTGSCRQTWVCTDLPSGLNAEQVELIGKSLADSDNFTFAVLGDSRGNPEKFTEILAAAAGHNPAFILHAGDLTNDGTADQLREAVALLEACPVPVVVIAGNHDLRTRAGQCFKRVFGPLDFYFKAGAYRFICSNNNDGILDGRFRRLPAGDGWERLETLAAGDAPAFLAMHMPPATKDLKDHVSLPITAPLTALLQRPGVDIRAILCGHVHGYAATELAGVPIIISGGAGAPLHDNDAVGFVSRNNFVLVSVRGGSISHTVHFVD